MSTHPLPQENKNAAKPSPTETLCVGGACALRLRGTRGARWQSLSEGIDINTKK
jgi:hypothetical protein